MRVGRPATSHCLRATCRAGLVHKPSAASRRRVAADVLTLLAGGQLPDRHWVGVLKLYRLRSRRRCPAWHATVCPTDSLPLVLGQEAAVASALHLARGSPRQPDSWLQLEAVTAAQGKYGLHRQLMQKRPVPDVEHARGLSLQHADSTCLHGICLSFRESLQNSRSAVCMSFTSLHTAAKACHLAGHFLKTLQLAGVS